MHQTQRKTVEGSIDKASIHLRTAKEHAKSTYQCSEAVQAAQAQVCIELSVKAALSLLGIKFPRAHECPPWEERFAEIARQITERQLLQKLASQDLSYTNENCR